MTIFINPGTEPQPGVSLDNAAVAVGAFIDDLPVSVDILERFPQNDADGWFGFRLHVGDSVVEVDVPGIDPEVVRKGEPWVSPRLYINGDSWLWSYALRAFVRALEPDEVQA
jgi:hypothetical protein